LGIEGISRPAASASQGAAGRANPAIPHPSAPVHIALAICCAVLIAFCWIAAPPGAMHDAGMLFLGVLLLMAIFQLPAVYWHHRGSAERRDAALMLPWALMLALLMAQMARTASTFTFPLRDGLWRDLDQHLGISVPAMMAWAARHAGLKTLLDDCYALVQPMLLCGIFLPPLFGKRESAERFMVANAVAFVIALPIVVLLPAVGPWVGWHFAPDPMQHICEMSIDTLRQGSIRGGLFGGTICLPSFHVFWAVVSAHALYSFRLLRYPAILLAALIAVATMTTGWHYGVDVITGLLLAAISTWLATMIVRMGRQLAQA
jgi:membrane-associated phospholipid phosphatase